MTTTQVPPYAAVAEFDGTAPTADLVRQAINFMIALEPTETNDEADAAYERRLVEQDAMVKQCRMIMRRYGEDISPLNFDEMQSHYNRITRSQYYLKREARYASARALLNSAWEGIGSWQS